ncbi:MAG: hypothetical protein ACI9LV_000987 [Candidatus Nanohaloarchaea archaeon]|jgi:hypothetical protein
MQETISRENEIEEIIYRLEKDPEVEMYDIDGTDHTQFELPSSTYEDEEVQEYVREIGAAMAEFAGEEGEAHYLTVDNEELEEYLSS